MVAVGVAWVSSGPAVGGVGTGGEETLSGGSSAVLASGGMTGVRTASDSSPIRSSSEMVSGASGDVCLR